MSLEAPAAAMAAPLVVALEGLQRVDCVADVHLHAEDTATALAFEQHVVHGRFDALLILGDLFEVWVGDDLLQGDDVQAALARRLAQALRRVSQQRPVWLMHGNRDFLLGTDFAAACGATLLPDPTVLALGGWRWLLSHGDAWCVADRDYQAWRTQARSNAWRTAFLAQPLAQRLRQARQLRAQSRQHQAQRRQAGHPWADVDEHVVDEARQRAGADGVIHGHTHRPAVHRLPSGAPRLVLSDWDAQATPPRLQVLRLAPGGGWSTVVPGS